MEYEIKIWGWEEKILERVMFDYIRWIFKIDFCTPRYITRRELGLEKLKISWEIRANMKYKEIIKGMEDTR